MLRDDHFVWPPSWHATMAESPVPPNQSLNSSANVNTHVPEPANWSPSHKNEVIPDEFIIPVPRTPRGRARGAAWKSVRWLKDEKVRDLQKMMRGIHNDWKVLLTKDV